MPKEEIIIKADPDLLAALRAVAGQGAGREKATRRVHLSWLNPYVKKEDKPVEYFFYWRGVPGGSDVEMTTFMFDETTTGWTPVMVDLP